MQNSYTQFIIIHLSAGYKQYYTVFTKNRYKNNRDDKRPHFPEETEPEKNNILGEDILDIPQAGKGGDNNGGIAGLEGIAAGGDDDLLLVEQGGN